MISLVKTSPPRASEHSITDRAKQIAATKWSEAGKYWYPNRGLATSGPAKESIKKPDLRRAAANSRPRNMIALACLMVVVYMYPTILRPMIGIGDTGEYRPSNRLNGSKVIEQVNLTRTSSRISLIRNWRSHWRKFERGDWKSPT